MAQVDLSGKSGHRIVFMKALRNGLKRGDLTQYQADKLRREYDE